MLNRNKHIEIKTYRYINGWYDGFLSCVPFGGSKKYFYGDSETEARNNAHFFCEDNDIPHYISPLHA